MPETLDPTKEPDAVVNVTNLAVKNITAGLVELIKQNALMVSEIKAEISGDEFNPFVNYQTQQELMEYASGVLNQIRHVFQLEAPFSSFVINKMLPTQDASAKGEN